MTGSHSSSTHSLSAIPALAIAAMTALAALAPLVGFFEGRWLVPLAIGLTALALAAVWSRDRRAVTGTVFRAGYFVPLVLLCGWAWISVSWSLDGEAAARGAAKMTGNLMFGAVLLALCGGVLAAGANRILAVLTAGVAVMAAVLVIEVVANAPLSALLGRVPNQVGLYWLDSALTVCLLLSFSAALWAWTSGRKAVAVAVLALPLGAAVALWAHTAAIAAVVGLVGAALVALARRWVLAAFAVLVAVAVMAAPALPGTVMTAEQASANPMMPNPLVHRLYIWENAAARIAEKPLAGWGMNAARVIPGGKARISDAVRGDFGEVMPLHPHNGALQVWLELGVPGAALTALFLAFLFLRLRRMAASDVAVGLMAGQMTFVLVQLSSSFGLWQSWWLVALWLAAGFNLLALGKAREARETAP